MSDKNSIFDVKKENAVLACLLTSPDLMFDSDLEPKYFNNAVSRDLFSVLDYLRKKSEAKKDGKLDFSPVQIESAAKNIGVKVDVEHIKTLRGATTSDGYVDVGSFNNYVSDLKDIAVRLKLFTAATDVQDLAVNDTKHTTSELIARAENIIISVEDIQQTYAEPKQIEVGGDEDIEECRTRQQTGIEMGLMTGFTQFDEALGGLRPGSLTVFGARAKTGKSLIAINIAYNMYLRYGREVPILYVDTEMESWEVRHRLWSIASGIPQRKIEEGKLTPAEEQIVKDAREKTKGMPLYHAYIPNFSPEGLVSLARKWKNSKGIGLMIFDYIKLPDSADNVNMKEYQSLGILTNALKNRIAGRLQIPCLTFGQLNRDGVKQAQAGEADETSISASDRIIHYCSSFVVFRKAAEKELMAAPSKDQPLWRNYGKYANRYMHMVATRNGGDESDPIPFYFDKFSLKITESGDYIPHGSNVPLRETISSRFTAQTVPSPESQS